MSFSNFSENESIITKEEEENVLQLMAKDFLENLGIKPTVKNVSCCLECINAIEKNTLTIHHK